MHRFLLLFLFLSFVFSSCTEEGCTDEAAVNYDITANKDDGSCVYCEVKEAQRGEASTLVVDTRNTSHPNYTKNVIDLRCYREGEVANDESCFDSQIKSCEQHYELTNLTAYDIQYLYMNVSTRDVRGSFHGFSLELFNLKAGATVEILEPIEISFCEDLAEIPDYYVYALDYAQ